MKTPVIFIGLLLIYILEHEKAGDKPLDNPQEEKVNLDEGSFVNNCHLSLVCLVSKPSHADKAIEKKPKTEGFIETNPLITM